MIRFKFVFFNKLAHWPRGSMEQWPIVLWLNGVIPYTSKYLCAIVPLHLCAVTPLRLPFIILPDYFIHYLTRSCGCHTSARRSSVPV